MELGQLARFAKWLVVNGWLPDGTDISALLERFLAGGDMSRSLQQSLQHSNSVRRGWKRRKGANP